MHVIHVITETFEPELTELFEIGSKNVLMDGALQINGAIFQTTTEDFQAASILTTQGAYRQTDTYINNYGKQKLVVLRFQLFGYLQLMV